MTYFKAILLIVCLGLIPKLALHSATLPQPDANGYTPQYVRPLLNDGDICASGYDCVQKPTTCDQTISTTTETSWPSLTGNVICLESDDHESRGDLILTSSGTKGSANECSTWKWLILDIDDLGYDAYPWNVGEANRAKVQRIEVNDQDCWIIHKLTFSKEQVDSKIVSDVAFNSDNIIVDSNLFEKNKGNSIGAIYFKGSQYLNIQNNVVRNCIPAIGHVQQSINVTPDSNSTDNFIVNNELYDCGSMTTSDEVSDPAINFKFENNDLYLTTASYYDGSGNPDITGPESMTENVATTKADGDQTYPLFWLHNRIWGLKPCDTNVACSGTPQAINMAGSIINQKTGDWVIAKNNIITDGEVGFACDILTDGTSTGCDRVSLIGNIFYNNNWQTTGVPGGVKTYNENTDKNDNWEIYLNTFIYNKDDASNEGGWLRLSGTDDADIRCNVVIDSDYDTAGTSAVLANNVYYNSENAGESIKQTHSTSVRANSTAYSVGDIIRTSNDPINDCNSKTDSDCFLYRVVKAGTSFTSPVTYCTQLGCETDDGTSPNNIIVRAIRGPYVYKRKLLTVSNGEEAFVPFAAVDTQAPEANPTSPYCPGDIGSVANRGINDDEAPW